MAIDLRERCIWINRIRDMLSLCIVITAAPLKADTDYDLCANKGWAYAFSRMPSLFLCVIVFELFMIMACFIASLNNLSHILGDSVPCV